MQIPVASVKTNCDESDIVEYLQCESFIDRFSITPFSFIRLVVSWSVSQSVSQLVSWLVGQLVS